MAVAELKPRLRGWLHAYAAAISIASGAVLIAVAAALRGGAAGATTAIYSATVTLLFGTSALYHRRSWSPRAHRIMKRLDHSMIFVFIAGTYTPIAVLSLPRTAAIAVLVDGVDGRRGRRGAADRVADVAALAVRALLHRARLGGGVRACRICCTTPASPRSC